MGAAADYGAMAATADSGNSWLDYVPGAREAYNYVVGKLAEFHVVGLQKLPGYERLLSAIGSRVRSSGDPVLNALYDDAQTATGVVRQKFNELEPRIRSLVSQFSSSGLGVLPLATLLAIAATIVAVAAAMYLFFGADAQNEDAVRKLVERAVATGVISEAEATRILRSGGSTFGSLGTGLTTIALVAAAIYFLPRRRG